MVFEDIGDFDFLGEFVDGGEDEVVFDVVV